MSPTLPQWPDLDYARDHATFDTLHLLTQMVGKVRTARTPWLNHSWHVTLYPSVRGLTTGPVPHTTADFDLEFDFLEHHLVLRTSTGQGGTLPLQIKSVAAFHRDFKELLAGCGVATEFHDRPNELPTVTPFAEDTIERAYDPDTAKRFWEALMRVDRVFREFRTGFVGKSSPSHFFWGSFDLAVTRFSGRPAPEHPGGIPNLPDAIAREAYSHAVSSAGFWTGGPNAPYPLFYSYAYPEPDGFRSVGNLPDSASFDSRLGEFVLPYDHVRRADHPEDVLMRFLEATYTAAADRGGWDREALECERGLQGVPRSWKGRAPLV